MNKVKDFFKIDLNAGLGWGILAVFLLFTSLPFYLKVLLSVMAGKSGFPRNQKAIDSGHKLGMLGNVLCFVPMLVVLIYLFIIVFGIFFKYVPKL